MTPRNIISKQDLKLLKLQIILHQIINHTHIIFFFGGEIFSMIFLSNSP